MFKRMLSMLLVLCLLLPVGVAMAETKGFIKDYTEISTGPGRDYFEPDVHLPYGTEVKAISRVWDDYDGVWQVLVEFQWGYDLCRAYVVNRRMYLSLTDVPVEQALQGCYLLYDADAFAGPGLTYTLWGDTVYRGTTATLLAVENGYGFIECWNGNRQKLWRVWVDLDTLSCGAQYGGGSFFDSEDWYNGAYGPTPTPRPSYYSYLPEVPYGGITPSCGNAKSIMWVQQCLRSCGYGELSVDGKWGNQTRNAVRAFREDYGFGSNDSQITYEMACKMLDVFYQRGMPLSYLRHYLPE